jgi:hypothetical protein
VAEPLLAALALTLILLGEAEEWTRKLPLPSQQADEGLQELLPDQLP